MLKIKFFKKKFIPFYFITIAAFFISLMAEFFTEGMFADGVVYSALARNMTDGLGSFWKPFYTANVTGFFDHPPFAFFVQSFIYKIFGDHIILDSLYSALTALGTIILMTALWYILIEHEKLKKLWFIPAFIWIVSPIVAWAYRHNLLENTMGMFTLLSVIFSVLAIKSTNKKYILWSILSGFSILAAFLTKGPVGLFPFATPLLYWIIFSNDKDIKLQKIIFITLINLFIILFSFFLFFFNPDAIYGFTTYVHKQIITGVTGKAKVVPEGIGRLFIIKGILQDGIPIVLGAGLLSFIFARKKIKKHAYPYFKEALFLLLVGISGSFPIMLSLKQSSFYSVPSLPFYILSGSIITSAACINLNKIKLNKILLIFSLILMIGSFGYIYSQKGIISRDWEILPDVKQIIKIVPKNSEIALINDKIYKIVAWDELQGYFYRYGYITITKFDKISKYALLLKDEKLDGYEISAETPNYNLWRKV